MIQAVLFDLDRTLLDRDQSLKNFVKKQYDSFQSLHQYIERDEFLERFIELDEGGYQPKEQVYKQLVARYYMDTINDQKLLDHYYNFFSEECIGFKGMCEMLIILQKKGIKLGIITNGQTNFQTANIRALDIEDFLDVILISEQEQMKKPDRRIFQKAAEQLQVPIESCLFVDDHVKNDVEGALAAGMKAIWKRGPDDNCRKEVLSIVELEEVIDFL
ncbi:HAD family hydrolase [Halobacillus shinanisalinarum]|uniref:HAD family hydrolase n=1 Tax=Halobacillus shinanisalinarum TaxID=2932258 RepID=A0ABY4GX33_9BACI|nr:HAD family hydrolase [Halobacillus shinanisalinarum]UOQ92698.1 HAD family hydrolase [Halobacillus shinanisalinarum]